MELAQTKFSKTWWSCKGTNLVTQKNTKGEKQKNQKKQLSGKSICQRLSIFLSLFYSRLSLTPFLPGLSLFLLAQKRPQILPSSSWRVISLHLQTDFIGLIYRTDLGHKLTEIKLEGLIESQIINFFGEEEI